MPQKELNLKPLVRYQDYWGGTRPSHRAYRIGNLCIEETPLLLIACTSEAFDQLVLDESKVSASHNLLDIDQPSRRLNSDTSGKNLVHLGIGTFGMASLSSVILFVLIAFLCLPS